MGTGRVIEMQDIKEALEQMIKDPERIRTERIEPSYLSDNLGRKIGTAQALAFPVSTEEVSRVMAFAYENGIPVTPRGAGTNLVGSTVPSGGIVLDFTRMNRVLEIDEETFTATVEPGVMLDEFQALAESRGLFYPPDPGEKKSSIGGNISTNAGGMRAVKYGVTRDYVMGLELVLADGTVIQTGSKNRKDTSGLDIKSLVIGSEGTLAVITKCLLKLLPKPEKSLSVLLSYDSLETGIGSVRRIFQANIGPTAIEFLQKKVVKLGEAFLGEAFPCPGAEAYLLLTFDGPAGEVAGRVKALIKTARESGAAEILELNNAEQAASVWRIRGCLVKSVEAVSEQEPMDIVVPINQIDRFVKFVNELEEKSGMRMISFGHAGDGNVHLCVIRGNRSEQEWKRELDRNLEDLYQKAHELGGLISGEHGLGLSKRTYFFEKTDPALVQLMNHLKTAFDRKGILNRKISYVQ